MSTIWESCDKSPIDVSGTLESLIEKCTRYLTAEDKEFILTTYNAGKYGYVLEYVYNKSMKVLQDVVFEVGEDVVISICHWVEKTVLSKFFDVFVLRLATQFDLITKKEKMDFFYINEVLQHRKENLEAGEELDKNLALMLIKKCFASIIFRDFSAFGISINEIINKFNEEEILAYSDFYTTLVNADMMELNLLVRILFAKLVNCSHEQEADNELLIKNVQTLFPLLWENISLNDKKFMSYYIKASADDSVVDNVFNSLSSQIKLQDFSMDTAQAGKLLKCCQEIISCHYSVNNHKGEVSPMITLSEFPHVSKLFLRSYITPSLITYLGNSFGYINESRMIAEQILESVSEDKWTFYFKNYFEKDDFVLITLILNDKCFKDWCNIIKHSGVSIEEIANEKIKELLVASKRNEYEKVLELAKNIYLN